jgi:hypothetical protein
MPSAKIYPDPVWKRLGIPSLHEVYQEKYENSKNPIAPYSGPRGHVVTLREEADEYKRAIREWRAHEYEIGEQMACCIKPQITLSPPKSKIDKFVRKFFCISYNIT